jgi:glycosyltransferase involved in cell wall biosynthesis
LVRVARIPFVRSDIYHIYTSIGDRLFLPRIKKRPLVVTGSAASSFAKIEDSEFYEKVDSIVVESRYQKDQLLDMDVSENKIRIIRPGIDLKKFRPLPVKRGTFSVLFASSPPSESQMEARGVFMLLDCAAQNPDIDFILIWRKAGYEALMKKIKSADIRNVIVKNKIIGDMRKEYAKADCVAAPYNSIDIEKPIPRSIVEAIACGKPVLVTSNVDIRDIVSQEQCGIVFMPDSLSMSSALAKLRKNYSCYQVNCRRTAEKYFSMKDFIENYSKIYEDIL